MTKNSPRIYLYKITFEEVKYYYYGVHKEKKFGEYYMGSPATHKWVWDFYTPKKQILEVFDFTDEGWLEAQEVEKRLIKPFYNTDKWCLNESCGGKVSLNICRNNGLKYGSSGGKTSAKLKVGAHSLTKEQKCENGIKGGKIGGKIGGKKIYHNKIGIHGRTKDQMIGDGKKGGSISGPKTYELGIGIFGLSPEKQKENQIEGGKIAAKNLNSQVWECTITKHRSNPGGLSTYQKKRGIDKSNRIRIN